jgi:hypothetical protein
MKKSKLFLSSADGRTFQQQAKLKMKRGKSRKLFQILFLINFV